MSWVELGSWWLEELADDPAYHEEVLPLLIELLQPQPGELYLDAGCGEGRTMEAIVAERGEAVGCDLSRELLRRANEKGPVVQADLPELGWIRPASFDGACMGLVLEHLAEEAAIFEELARSVRSGGVLAIVINHPIFTAPRSSPMDDASGEILWRPGDYFSRGWSDEPAGDRTVRFYHRTIGDLFTSAAAAGWDLQRVVEQGVSSAQIARVPEFVGQENIPRLMGCRWRRR